MEFIYMLLYGSDWDETKIILSMEEAINASIKHPECKVAIFSRFIKENRTSYRPIYDYYNNGELITISSTSSNPSHNFTQS